jgi:hypothetical protein
MKVISQPHVPAAFEEEAPSTHWICAKVGPKVGLDAVEKREISFPYR